MLVKDADRYHLSDRGSEWLFSDPVIAMSWGAVGAYSCLLYELVPALRGEKHYGVDFKRDEDYLAVGSHATGKANYPWVVDEMSRLGARCVADLGCGTADVLIAFCSLDQSLHGVGVDISPKVLVEADRRVRAAGFQDRIRLVEGDLTKPETFSSQLSDVDAFNAIMVFHEFLRFGEDWVVDLLCQIKARFPGRYMFMGEFDRVSDEEFASMPLPDRIHPLFYQYIIHPLKREGQPIAKGGWLKIFEKAGLEVLKIKDDFPFRLTEYVLRL